MKLSQGFLFIIAFLFAVGAKGQRYVSIYFKLNEAVLTEAGKTAIDSQFVYGELVSGQKIKLIGYYDQAGAEKNKEQLWEARAQNVKRYLMEGYDFPEGDIVIEKGKPGSRMPTGLKPGDDPNRRVDIEIQSRKKKAAAAPPPPAKKNKGLGNIMEAKENETVAMENIYFVGSSHRILEKSASSLEKLLKVMEENPNLKIRVEGHICCLSGGLFYDGYDVETGLNNLSTARAKVIYDYLVQGGIEADRLKYIGLGHSHPAVAVEVTEEDMEKNRRVEIRVLSK